jgi:hypothetical protein
MKQLEKFFNELVRFNEFTGFVHNDMHAGNVLFNNETEEFVLIDYGRSYINPGLIKEGSKLTDDNIEKALGLDDINEALGLVKGGGRFTLDSYTNCLYFRKLNSAIDSNAIWADIGGLMLSMVLNDERAYTALTTYIPSINEFATVEFATVVAGVSSTDSHLVITKTKAIQAFNDKTNCVLLRSFAWISFYVVTFYNLLKGLLRSQSLSEGSETFPEVVTLSKGRILGTHNLRPLYVNGYVFADSYDTVVNAMSKLNLSGGSKKATLKENGKTKLNKTNDIQKCKKGGGILRIDVKHYSNTQSLWELVYKEKKGKTYNQSVEDDYDARLSRVMKEFSECDHGVGCSRAYLFKNYSATSMPMSDGLARLVNASGGGDVSRLKNKRIPKEVTTNVKVYVLGRERVVRLQGRQKMVVYKKELIPLSEARAIETKLTKQSIKAATHTTKSIVVVTKRKT